MPSCRDGFRIRSVLRSTLRFFAPLVLAIVAPLAAAADESPGFWGRMALSLESTMPIQIASPESRSEGFWKGTWDGTKRIWNEGSRDLYVSGYVWHSPYTFPAEKRERFNNYAWGLGYGRTLTDERNNQRMFYGIVASDSYNHTMAMAGYAWLARWQTNEARIGAGYSALILYHQSTLAVPFPVAAPVVSLGGDTVAFYGTYIHGMAYFFAKVSVDK